MRINSIMAQRPNLMSKNLTQKSTPQNINFGMIQDKKTEELTKQMMMEELNWYDEEDKKDPNSGYKEDVDYVQQKLDYFKASRLFTLKSVQNNFTKKDMLYVAMNQEEVEKHEHSDVINEYVDYFKKNYSPAINMDDEQKAELYSSPGFLKFLEYYAYIDDFYNEMQHREQGKRPELPKPSTPSDSSDESDNPDSFKARQEAIKDMLIYGTMY